MHKSTGVIFELTLIQNPQLDKRGNDIQYLILKNPDQKYPISVSKANFEKDYCEL